VKGKGEGGEGAERYLGGGQAEARGRNGVWIRSGAGCLRERAGGCGVGGSLSKPNVRQSGKGQKEQKTLGPKKLEKHKKRGLFRRTAGGRRRTKRRGAGGRVRALEAH
jgi:hypothetical protein